jgi:hypothetical protein
MRAMGPFSQPVAPFRIVGNIYYVGGVNLASYLVTTPEGHVLIDTDTAPEPDIVLVGHPQTMFAGTMERMRKGERPHPQLNGREAWTNQLTASEQAFERRVAQEQS